jgi:hypothetical protein
MISMPRIVKQIVDHALSFIQISFLDQFDNSSFAALLALINDYTSIAFDPPLNSFHHVMPNQHGITFLASVCFVSISE